MIGDGTILARRGHEWYAEPSSSARMVTPSPFQRVFLDLLAAEDGDIASSDQTDCLTDQAAWSRLVMRSLAHDWDSEDDRIYDKLS
jgi:hypothetical protein